jgi:hypothetical protein
MKHATEASLQPIRPLLEALRQLRTLQEKRPGVFYVRSRAFLHFHEDPAGLFADLRIAEAWERLPVNGAAEQDRLLRAVAGFLANS